MDLAPVTRLDTTRLRCVADTTPSPIDVPGSATGYSTYTNCTTALRASPDSFAARLT